MKREDKIKIAILKGYKYDSLTGYITGPFGRIITTKNGSRGIDYIQMRIYVDYNKSFNILGHQFAWYYMFKECVECLDHINGIKNDNRIENLRSVTQQENCFNTNAKGYSYKKESGKFNSYIMKNGYNKYLGSFEDEDSAREAYLEAKKILHLI